MGICKIDAILQVILAPPYRENEILISQKEALVRDLTDPLLLN